MPRIDPATLARADAQAMLAESLHGADVAARAAGIAGGAAKRRCAMIARQHGRNAIALADVLHGAPSADVVAMSDDDLARELGA